MFHRVRRRIQDGTSIHTTRGPDRPHTDFSAPDVELKHHGWRARGIHHRSVLVQLHRWLEHRTAYPRTVRNWNALDLDPRSAGARPPRPEAFNPTSLFG